MNALRHALLLLTVVLLGAFPALGAASDWSVNEQSRVRLITPYQTAPRSGELQLGLHFTLTPGWHVYWKNSGDAGFPPVVTVREPAGTKAEMLWPAPRRFELPGDLVAFGYEDEVVYPLRIPAPATADGSRPLSIEVDYLVCEVDCIPYRYTLSLAQPVGDSPVPDPQTAPLLESWTGRVAVPAEQLAGASTDGALVEGPGGPALEVRVRGVAGDPAAVGLFLESQDTFATGKPAARAEDGGLVFRVPLSPREVNKPLPETTAFAWTATGLRHPPQGGSPVSLEARREVGRSAPAAPETETTVPVSVPRTLLFAFLGGLLLNLTPMVLALLIPELLELRQEPEKVRRHAGAAALGVLLVCWGIALAGTRLQEPVTAAVLAVAASALLAFNLWGFLELPVTPPGATAGRHLLAGLWTPLLAMIGLDRLLAAPSGFATATALGLGLALPYLVLALAPGVARALPAPGAWSGPLRGVLGFAAGAGALWALYALARQVTTEGLAAVELGLLAMALFAWLRHRTATRVGVRFSLAAGLAVCALALPWLADRNRLSPRPGAAQAFTTGRAPVSQPAIPEREVKGGHRDA